MKNYLAIPAVLALAACASTTPSVESNAPVNYDHSMSLAWNVMNAAGMGESFADDQIPEQTLASATATKQAVSAGLTTALTRFDNFGLNLISGYQHKDATGTFQYLIVPVDLNGQPASSWKQAVHAHLGQTIEDNYPDSTVTYDGNFIRVSGALCDNSIATLKQVNFPESQVKMAEKYGCKFNLQEIDFVGPTNQVIFPDSQGKTTVSIMLQTTGVNAYNIMKHDTEGYWYFPTYVYHDGKGYPFAKPSSDNEIAFPFQEHPLFERFDS